ncbi:MAG: tetratricopeptide repeat protein, partial [Candidatus Riflebacteria bacterium]|nr:tetratricopeptide repeat protein [Candidatus Riflebacteria bacterium]
ITDTGSIFDENLYTVLDTSDLVFFIINFGSLSTITDNVRFFHGISKLSYPRERLILLGNNIGSDFSTSKTSRVFPYPVIGGLPRIADFEPQFGKPAYDLNPTSPYCEVLRLLVRNVLKETNLKKPQTKGSIFSMLFGEKDPEQVINLQLMQLNPPPGSSFSPIINQRDVRSQVKYVRYNLLFGYIEEAKTNLLSFMEYSQSSAPLCEMLGEIFLVEEKLSESLEAFQKAISLDSEQHVALGFLSFLTGSKENFDRAIAAVEAKIAANPSHLDLINDYGKILLVNEHYEEAAIQFKKALKSNPNYLEAKINLSTCLSKCGKSEDAIEMLLGVENKNPRLFYTLGEIFYQSGRLYLAYKAYNKASSLYPSYPGLRPKLFELSGYLRKLDTVIDLHEKFVNTSPNFPDLHTKLANFYHLAGKSELAITQFKKALAINPSYKEAKVKLEAIQKDAIWRLARLHLEEDIADAKAITRSLKATVHFISGEEQSHFPEEAVLHIKNVGTSKTIQKAINATQLESGTADLDLSPLGLLANQDILLFQIAEVKSGNIIRFAPHYLEKDEILAGHCSVDLDFDLSHESDGMVAHLTKYFLVHLESKKFAGLLSTNGSAGHKAVLKNETNGLEAMGYLNPENDGQINFVLNASDRSSEGIAAVSPGDKLSIKVMDSKKTQAFSMDFSIGKADVLNFYKTIVPQEEAKSREAS